MGSGLPLGGSTPPLPANKKGGGYEF